MKKLLNYCLASFFTISLLFSTSCAKLDVGSDPVVVKSEQTIRISTYTLDAFFKLERTNKDKLLAINPKIHDFAQSARLTTPNYIRSANIVLRTYKSSRTAENKVNLNTVIATLVSAANQAQTYLEQIK